MRMCEKRVRVKMMSEVEGDVCDGGLVRFVKRARFAK